MPWLGNPAQEHFDDTWQAWPWGPIDSRLAAWLRQDPAMDEWEESGFEAVLLESS